MQTALSNANRGDTTYAAPGTYTGTGAAVVTFTRSIALLGGWNRAAIGPIVRDPAAYPSILDGDPRPLDSGPDIGADETRFNRAMYLPVGHR